MEERTYEYCPWCGTESEISANEPTPCPNCGHILNPCSTCYDHLDGYKECDWTEEKGCWRFPKEEL